MATVLVTLLVMRAEWSFDCQTSLKNDVIAFYSIHVHVYNCLPFHLLFELVFQVLQKRCLYLQTFLRSSVQPHVGACRSGARLELFRSATPDVVCRLRGRRLVERCRRRQTEKAPALQRETKQDVCVRRGWARSTGRCRVVGVLTVTTG